VIGERPGWATTDHLTPSGHMPIIARAPASGARVTRLGLVALGFVVGILVTLLVLFMFKLRT
jgi:hypothetical protein